MLVRPLLLSASILALPLRRSWSKLVRLLLPSQALLELNLSQGHVPVTPTAPTVAVASTQVYVLAPSWRKKGMAGAGLEMHSPTTMRHARLVSSGNEE